MVVSVQEKRYQIRQNIKHVSEAEHLSKRKETKAREAHGPRKNGQSFATICPTDGPLPSKKAERKLITREGQRCTIAQQKKKTCTRTPLLPPSPHAHYHHTDTHTLFPRCPPFFPLPTHPRGILCMFLLPDVKIVANLQYLGRCAPQHGT